jgi:hypothetical protein
MLKLDFKEAFESVNWETLDAILDALGLGPCFGLGFPQFLTLGEPLCC